MIEISNLEDDGLLTPEIGPWGIEKYRHVTLYSSLFIKSMRKHWECLVYIDLFSGAGRSKIRRTDKIIPASPIIALTLEQKFNKYIFCERDEDKFRALYERIIRNYDSIDVSLINGDANIEVDKIVKLIPEPAKSFRVLSFCFVDPSKLDDLKFLTLQRLFSARYTDYLVLIPSGMDAARVLERYYFSKGSTKLDDFLGRTNWRQSLKEDEQKGIGKEEFVVKEFCKSMKSIGLIDPGLENTLPIFSEDKNLLLYRLVLFSRRELGNNFWREAKKNLKLQREIIFPSK